VSRQPYARPDARTRAAKAQGYPARSVFKLEEIDRRTKLLLPGQRVLDLGAAPGSWSLYAATRIGDKGVVLAIDRQPISQVFPPHVRVVQGDALTLETAALSELGPYDVVLSDMAPNTSGTKAADQARSFELFMRAVDVARELGRAGSHFVGKLFMSADFEAARAALTQSYEKCQVIRAEGTRSRSSEVFLVGLRRKA
jgi:23S rRNA (uridine2552-2'-O)-methyltransferase